VENDPTATDEFVLLLWMAVGRNDANHPFHPYLASLPQLPSLPMNWPTTLTDTTTSLQGTNLGAAFEKHRTLINTTYRRLVDIIQTKCPTMLPSSYNFSDLAWAHDNYLSRRLPKRLSIEPAMIIAEKDNNTNTSNDKNSNKDFENGKEREGSKGDSSPVDLNQSIVASTCSPLNG
jgi:hypothetical protein